VIGTWDNDQGKGLDQPFPPERELKLSARYPGKLMEIGWRSDYPLDQRGKLNLHELLSPTRWQVAYGASAFEVPEATHAQLRVSSSEPFKVWVNDELIVSVSRLDGWRFDGFVLPIKLNKGVNRVLIKSAQQTGVWLLAARLTSSEGAPLEVEFKPADTPLSSPSQGDQAHTPLNISELIEGMASRFGLTPESARGALLLSEHLGSIGLNMERVERVEQALKAHPNSLLLKRELTHALWTHGERGRAADLLSELYRGYGEALPALVTDQARFWAQQQLDVKARSALRNLIERAPELVKPRLQLVSLYAEKGWHAERCALAREGLNSAPHNGDLYGALALCEPAVGRPLEGREALNRVEHATPLMLSTLKRQLKRARGERRYADALSLSQQCVASWPQVGFCYRSLAKAERAVGRLEAALKALEAASALNPLDAEPYLLKGEWLSAEGRTDEALEAWRAALERDPDNQRLNLRLSELNSTGAELWMSDVPSEEQIAAVIAARGSLSPAEGANLINLIDDEVTLLNPDGSTVNVITTVAYAVNQEGRDDLTKLYISRSKGTQLMAAYAINPDDTRVEASSIRDGVVRFRQLEVGSVVVLQYRYHTRPSAYLAGSISRFWWFHTDSTQVRHSRFALWLPKDMALHESRHTPPALKSEALKELKREERVEGELKRVTWQMSDLPPLVGEPRMPPRRDVAYGIEVSTVPDWEDMWKWERELLREAFRMSPKVKEVTDALLAEAQSPQEKILKIHEYVIEKIRYQQDYEQTIAGVKPHSAAQVLSRQYGDCKDKAVLFITMAQRAGLEAHFALVKTRNAGEVDTKIPSQQFNHAIVYVPQQEGIAEGRFFDPTVDTLDIETLRFDDQGTTSLVYNPKTREHSWREIPFQESAFNATRDEIKLTLNAEGDVEGTLVLSGRGEIGQILRQRARNPEAFKQVMQYRLHQLFPGAEMTAHEPLEVESLFKPASASISFKLGSWAKKEGESLRLPAVIDWSPKGYFHLEERRFPLNFGVRREWSWHTSVSLPEGYELSHLPSNEQVKTPCLSLERQFKREEGRLISEWRYASLCENLSPEDYQAQREKAREMMVLLNQEVVLSVRKVTPKEE
jgi:tetratricopeptide (TPR) repeat protein